MQNHQLINQTSGIYRIVNLVNGNSYIGSAVNLKRRQREHCKQLRAGRHHCIPLQRAWSKYGESSFMFETLEAVAMPALLAKEQFYLESVRRRTLYNVCLTAGSQLGVKRSAETILRMREAFKHRKRPDPFTSEHRRNLSRALSGMRRTPEQIARQRERMRGATLSPECIILSAALRRGKPGTPHTEESKRKIAEWQRLRPPPSLETRLKMRLAKLGHFVSDVTRAKMSESQRRQHAERRLRE